MSIVEILLLPAMAWMLHRQEQQMAALNKLENKLIRFERVMPKRSDDFDLD